MANCVGPVNIRNPVDPSGKTYIAVPCGKCAVCLQNKRSDWFIRLREEWKISKSAWFITLTYNDENLPVTEFGEISLCKRDIQLFIKRLRKTTSEKIRYFVCGEYGSNTNRPHYHMLLFNFNYAINDVKKYVNNCWNCGNVDVGFVTDRSINYTAKYIINRYDKRYTDVQQPYTQCSKGIGISYIDRCGAYHNDNIYNNWYTLDGGIKKPLPRYYKKKLYTTRKKQLIMRNYNDQIAAQSAFTDWVEEAQKIHLKPDLDRIRERTIIEKQKLNLL